MKMEKQHIHIGENEVLTGYPQNIIKPVWFSVSIYDSWERYDSELSGFSMPQRYVFAIQWYLGETYNGGHDQFFFNSTGIVWRDALEGFRTIGLTECVDILSEAVKRMGGEPPFDREERWAVMDELEPDFGDIDSRLYAIDEQYMYGKLMDYIRSNKEAFYFDGDIALPMA